MFKIIRTEKLTNYCYYISREKIKLLEISFGFSIRILWPLLLGAITPENYLKKHQNKPSLRPLVRPNINSQGIKLLSL